jgi:hypothetical protein
MSLTPEHAELQEMLPAAALEILEVTQMEQVIAHIRECPECATLLQEYRDATVGLVLHVPRRRMDVRRAGALRARLMARAQFERAIPVSRKASSMVYQWSGWMVAAGLAGVLLVHHSIHRPLDHGWMVAAVLGVIVLGLGVYSWAQRNRLAELERRQEGSGTPGKEDGRQRTT